MEPIIKNDVPPTEEKDKEGEERYRFTDEKNLKRASIRSAGIFWTAMFMCSLFMVELLLFLIFLPLPGFELSKQARIHCLYALEISILFAFFFFVLRNRARERRKFQIQIEELESELQDLKRRTPDLLEENTKPTEIIEKSDFERLCEESSPDYLPRLAAIPEILKRAEEIGYKPKDGKKFALVENRVLQDCALRTAVLETYKKQGRKEPAGTLLSAYAEIFKTN